jgi:hypothetical protein
VDNLALFSNLNSLTLDTPGVLVGLPWSDDFGYNLRLGQSSNYPPSFSLDKEEVKLADKWSKKLAMVQNITLIYAYELYNRHFFVSEGDEGRHIILSKVENEEGIQWVWSNNYMSL